MAMKRDNLKPLAEASEALAAEYTGSGKKSPSARTLRRWGDTGRITKYVDGAGRVYVDLVEAYAEVEPSPVDGLERCS